MPKPLVADGQSELRHSPDESTALLSRPVEQHNLPSTKFQTRILYLILFCEVITSMVIYPFINQLVISMGIEEKKVGYVSGIIESVFFLAQGVTVVPWQLASERFGRRPVLLFAPLGIGLAMIAFGLADSLWGLLVAQIFLGIFNGDVGVAKTMLVELTDSSDRAEVMAMAPVITSFGAAIAPFIGGTFSEPAENWPNTLGRIRLLQQRPYLLPCILCSALCFIYFALAVTGLKETHPILKDYKSPARRAEGTTPIRPPLPRLSALLTRNVTILLTLGVVTIFCFGALRTLQALIWSTSIKNGGLGFSAYTIGFSNTLFRFPGAVLQLLVLGRLTRYFGSRNGMILSIFVSLLALFSFPFQIYFAKIGGSMDWRVWGWIVWQQFVCLNVRPVGSAVLLIYAVDVSSTPSSIAAIQGLLLMAQVGARAVAPALSSALFAYGNSHGAGGARNLVYGVLGVLYAGAGGLAFLLPKV
ncbi:major facilitator superfamily domain-containing protein [Flagelloscypha sp. PMI_526]|nr:major facilitator superfamily domain-containing protein [Flagelloscypha sp. PMI_526]